MLLGTQALIGVWVMWLAEGARSGRTRDRYVTGDEKQEASFILKVLKRHRQRRFKPELDRISEAANSTLERSGEKQMCSLCCIIIWVLPNRLPCGQLYECIFNSCMHMLFMAHLCVARLCVAWPLL